MVELKTEGGSAIKLMELSKRYGSLLAVDDISFDITRGQVTGFLGPNGAGKSTTLRIICGLLQASSGRAYVDGISIANYPLEIKRKIGYMAEHNPLPEDMRVQEYLYYRARLKEIPRAGIKLAVDEAMEVCDLHRSARRRIIGNLSKGFRQRVGIADAILAKPEIIIMDEPTIGLDPHQVIGIRKLIGSLRGKMTLLLSSHILSEMELCCDEIIIINQGRIVASGRTEELRNEFVPPVGIKIQLKGEFTGFKDILLTIAPEAKVMTQSPPDIEGFSELIIETPSRDSVSEELLKVLADENGFRIREIAQLNGSLEEVFLAATRRGWDEIAQLTSGRNSK